MKGGGLMLKYVLSHPFLFCFIFASVAGVVNALNKPSETTITIKTLLSKWMSAGVSGLLLFFLTNEVIFVTPSKQLAGALVIGYFGTAIFEGVADRFKGFLTTEEDKDDGYIGESKEAPAFVVDNSISPDEVIPGLFEMELDESNELIGSGEVDNCWDKVTDDNNSKSDEESIG